MARTQILKSFTPKFHQSYKYYVGIREEKQRNEFTEDLKI
jgi:hypothetical protein